MFKYGTQFAISAIFIILSLVGVIIVLLSTAKYGVGLSPDSVQYISSSRNLSSGNGYLSYDGNPLVHWPPLFPTLLAVFDLLGIDPIREGIKFLNAFVFGLLILSSGKLSLICIRDKTIAILFTVSILLSVPLLSVSIMAWSESLFTLLTVLFFINLIRYLDKPKWSSLILISALAAIASLQRYIGVAAILTGFFFIVIGMRKTNWLSKAKHAMVFGTLSTTPLVVWAIRNYIVASTFAGERLLPEYTFSENLLFAIDTMTIWLLPTRIPLFLRTAIIVLGLLVFVILFFRRLDFKDQLYARITKVMPIPVYLLTYLLILLFAILTSDVSVAQSRFLSPLYVFIMLLVFMGVESILTTVRNSTSKYKPLLSHSIIILCSLFLLYPLGRVVKNVYVWNQTGAGGYNTVPWKESRTMFMLDNLPLNNSNIYSNAPDAIYIQTGRSAQSSPLQNMSILEFQRRLPTSNTNYLVWFNNKSGRYLHQIDELAEILHLKEMYVLEDGTIYLIES